MSPDRAFILLRSGRKLDLLNPDPQVWTDDDLATGLSRTYRWGGHSRWPLPLSVAQHSLLVLAIHEDASGSLLSYPQMLRELLHDAEEALLGGFDPVTPLRPHLGPGFAALTARLSAAVACRYQLPAWTPDEHARHKHADRLAAASEAHHVAGWSLADMKDSLGIELSPLVTDPLLQRYGTELPAGMQPWEPWPASLAARLFLAELERLVEQRDRPARLVDLAAAFSRLPARLRARCRHPVTGSTLSDTYVLAEAHDGSQSLEGVVVDGERDPDGTWDFDAVFTVFTTDDKAEGELLRVAGYAGSVEVLR